MPPPLSRSPVFDPCRLLLRVLRHDRRHAARVAAVRITGVAEIQLRRALGNRDRLDVAGAGAGQAVTDNERLAERRVQLLLRAELVAAAAELAGLHADEHADQPRAAGIVRPAGLGLA